ncbi:MAG: NUDIX hydrolase [Kiloniellales bacterium]
MSEEPGRFARQVPEGDDRERRVCRDCGFVDYENPKIVVGSVATWEGRILLCRRAIPPRLGFWTLPAGYLEVQESPETGAKREAWEEARAKIVIDQLMAVYTIERLSQVQLIYRAALETPDVEAGPESQEVGLFDWSEIPWKEVAFPSVLWALRDHRDIGQAKHFATRINPEDADGAMEELLRVGAEGL